jgi:hypothetical protein
MTLVEMAAKLDVTNHTLRQQIHRGALKAEKIGAGRHAIWLVSDEEYERYRREHHGKRGFAAESHPLHGKGRPRRSE